MNYNDSKHLLLHIDNFSALPLPEMKKKTVKDDTTRKFMLSERKSDR